MNESADEFKSLTHPWVDWRKLTYIIYESMLQNSNLLSCSMIHEKGKNKNNHIELIELQIENLWKMIS